SIGPILGCWPVDDEIEPIAICILAGFSFTTSRGLRCPAISFSSEMRPPNPRAKTTVSGLTCENIGELRSTALPINSLIFAMNSERVRTGENNIAGGRGVRRFDVQRNPIQS